MKYASLLVALISGGLVYTSWAVPPNRSEKSDDQSDDQPNVPFNSISPRSVESSGQQPLLKDSLLSSLSPPSPSPSPSPPSPVLKPDYYSTCEPGEIDPVLNVYASKFQYFSYGSHTSIFDVRTLEEEPRLGVVFEHPGSGGSRNYFAAASHPYWYWWYEEELAPIFYSETSPRRVVFCDTPGKKNAWLPYNGQSFEHIPEYLIRYHSFYDESEYVSSFLCAYEHEGQLITGVTLDNQPFYTDLPSRYECAGIIVTRIDNYKVKYNADSDSDNYQGSDTNQIPLHGPLKYILAGVPNNEPEANSACQTDLGWYHPEAVLPEQQLSRDEVVAFYPPDDVIHYCQGYTAASHSSDLIRVFGIERPSIHFHYMPEGNSQTYTGVLEGGCIYPGGEQVEAFALKTDSEAVSWELRYQRLVVPVNTGWIQYSGGQSKGARAGCRSTMTDADPVYLCRYHSLLNSSQYVYGVFQSSGEQGICRAVSLYENRNLLPAYGTDSSTQFEVYDGTISFEGSGGAGNGDLPSQEKSSGAVKLLLDLPVLGITFMVSGML